MKILTHKINFVKMKIIRLYKYMNNNINSLSKKWSIINTEWNKNKQFISNNIINLSYGDTKTISSIDAYKKYLENKLGYIPVYFFLNHIFGNYVYSGNYKSIDKGIVLLYHILSGEDKSKFNNTIPGFNKFYKDFWNSRYDELNKVVDNYLKTLFSDIELRIYNGKENNPENINFLTFTFDSYIRYNKINNSNRLFNKGMITQYICDNNGFITYVSMTKKYYEKIKNGNILNEIYFSDIILDIDVDNDVIAFDEETYNFKDTIIRNTKEKLKKDISENIVTTITDEDVISDDIYYNSNFNEYIKKGNHTINNIENMFLIFKNDNYIRSADIKIYNLQFKIAILLYNIKIYTEKYNIPIKKIHKKWYEDETFDFSNNIKYTNSLINTNNNANIIRNIIKNKSNNQKK